MNQLLHILKYKAVAYVRLNTKLNFGAILKNLGSGLIYLGFAVGAFFFSQRMIKFLLVDAKVGLFLLHEFISMVLFIFFISVNVGNIIVSYSTLYKSNEVNFLFTKPINPSKIFLLKFLDNFFYSSSTMIMVMLAVLAGYAVYFHITIIDLILLVLLNVLPFILSAGSLGVIILLVVIKLVSKFGVRKILYPLIGTYLATIFLFFKINSPIKLVNVVMKYYPFLNKDKYLGDLIPGILKLLPNHWLSESAYWTVLGHPSSAYFVTIMQISVSAVLFITALMLGRKWYFDTWLQNLKISSTRSSLRNNNSVISFEKKSRLNSQTESIIKKDLIAFTRESSQVIHISVLFFLIVVFVMSVSGIKYFKFGGHVLITSIYLSILLFNLLLISTFSLRFVFPILSLEGLPFWKIKSAPINSKFYLIRKILPFGLIILIIGQGLSLFSNITFGWRMVLQSGIITLIATITILSINFGMGCLFVNYKEKNPIRLSSSQGASISFLVSIGYMLFVVVLLFSPLLELFYDIRIGAHFSFNKLAVTIIPIAIISFMVTTAFVKLSINAMKKDF